MPCHAARSKGTTLVRALEEGRALTELTSLAIAAPALRAASSTP